MQPRNVLEEQKAKWQKKLMEKSGTFLAVCVFNGVILLLLSSLVIYHFIAPQLEDPMVFAKVKTVVPPPPKPVSKGGDAQKSVADPTVVVVPPPTASLSVVTTTNPTAASFTLQTAEVSVPNSLPSFALPSGGGLSQGTSGGGVPQANPFGSNVSDGGTPALVGYFYDLKQTNDDPPKLTGITQQEWRAEMLKLVSGNLNEETLSKYFKSTDPRTTNGFSIPEQPSANAPAAFGLAGKVKPSLWAIVYHGKAIAPEAGRYRFVGIGDDMLVILKDGKMVFDGGWQHMTTRNDLHNTYANIWTGSSESCKLRQGEWFSVDQGQTISLDVAIGDWGGLCGFFLFLEKDGVNYDKLADGTPKLPLFQLGAKLKQPSGPNTPPSSDSDTVWTSAVSN